MESGFQIPVTVVVFNRPEVTRIQFELLKKVKPKQLFVISDAAREGRPEEKEKVQAVRDIFEQVDWDCTVHKNYASENMGCDVREPDGITWVFGQVKWSVILEDDSLPDLSFFTYCEELLRKYENEEQVMLIAGVRFMEELKLKDSYDFVYRGNTTGAWATWARAWRFYELHDGNWTSFWQEVKELELLKGLFPENQKKGFIKEIDDHFEKGVYPWDYLWHIATFVHRGLCIIPEVNLVENIGFSQDATHTTERLFFFPEKAHRISFPLRHPKKIERNPKYERLFFKKVLQRPLYRRILSRGKKMLLHLAGRT